MSIEYRLVTFSEREQIKDVVKTREKMMRSTNAVHENFLSVLVDNEDNFNRNFIYGCFENGLLDNFWYADMWTELPYYSTIAFSRAKSNRMKFDNGFDKLVTETQNFQLKHCEEMGFTTWLGVSSASSDWRPWHLNKYSRHSHYNSKIIEVIKAGHFSKYSAIYNHMVSRPFNIDLNVRIYTLPSQSIKEENKL